MRKCLFVVLGTLLMALSLNLFLAPENLVTGGASGLGVIVYTLSEKYLHFAVPLWFTNLAVNVPLLLWAFIGRGRHFAAGAAAGTLLLSFFLKITQSLGAVYADNFIAAVFGGVIMGAGMGMVLAGGAATGGSDLLASLLMGRLKSLNLNLAALVFIVDLTVITGGMFVFGGEKAMYSIVSVYISAQAANLVLEGLNFARVVFVMSDMSDKIAAAIMSGLGHGATLLYGKGAYTGHEKNVVMAVVARRQVAKVKNIVSAVDKTAFMFVTDVREVLGDFSP